MKGIKNKGIAAAGTLLFLALVRTNQHPTMWQIGLVALIVYEGMILCMQYTQTTQKKMKRNRTARIREEDARRWAEEWFNPLKEVS